MKKLLIFTTLLLYSFNAYSQTPLNENLKIPKESSKLENQLKKEEPKKLKFCSDLLNYYIQIGDDKGILKCAIEKAFFEGKTDFRKPLSCHLFPIRITEYKKYDAINYQQLAICIPGKECGKAAKLPLYKFLKEPLIRKYGAEWYEEVEATAEFLDKNK